MNTAASSYSPADKLDSRILRNFLSAHVQTPAGVTFAWELLPPVTMPLLRQVSHELLSAIYSQADAREFIYLPSLVCIFEGTNLKGACVPEGYSRIGLVHGKTPAVIRRESEPRPQAAGTNTKGAGGA